MTRERMHLPDEAWKPVSGFAGRYEVSDAGRIWSLLTSRILTPARTSKGYFSVSLAFGSTRQEKRSVTVHSLVAEAFIGPRPNGLQVDHIDGDKRNNSAKNLRYVTQSENIRGAIRRGRIQPRGIESVNAKLTEDIVREIRVAFANGELNADATGRKYSVNGTTIRSAAKGKTYRNVI